jgi:hypothetical protein
MMTTLLALSIVSALAAQSPCDERAVSDGPMMVPLQQADFGVFRRACPRSEVALGVGGRAIVEEENFYADLRGNGRLDVSTQPFDALELHLSLEPLFYEQVIQSFRASHTGLGDASVGATLLAFTSDFLALSILTRATLPTAWGYYRNAHPFGFDAGLLLLLEPVTGVRLHAGVLALGSVAVTRADPDPRPGLGANLGMDFVIFDWLSIVTDLNGQALLRDPLDRITIGFGARASLGDAALEFGTAIPVAGADRHLGAALLRISYRFW